MRPDRRLAGTCLLLLLSHASQAGLPWVAAQAVVTQGARLSLDVSPVTDQLAVELEGGIWLLPRSGGPATLLAQTMLPASHPRWSPDGQEIVFASGAGNISRLWRVDLRTREARRLESGDHFDTGASWHPDGNRVVFSSNREGSLDLWERDLQNNLSWRLTHHVGQETDPAWSANGRDLAYILEDPQGWALILRRFGEPDAELLRSSTRLAAPSWRPDGTLLTYLQHTDRGVELRMAILSEPPLFRTLAPVDAYAEVPVAWLDRSRMYFAAGGRIRTRRFDDWRANTVVFRATVKKPPPKPEFAIGNRDLPVVTPATNGLVIRSDRVFDGLSQGYRSNLDVRIENGLVAEVTSRRDWGNLPVIELPGTTLMPGLIDAYASLAGASAHAQGAALLSWGVTTIVSPAATEPVALRWEGEEAPGPRLLRARRVPQHDDPALLNDPSVYLWTLAPDVDSNQPGAKLLSSLQDSGQPVMAEDGIRGLKLNAAALLGTDLLAPRPPGGTGNVSWPAAERPPALMVSGLARTGNLPNRQLYEARQAHGLSQPAARSAPVAALPDLRAGGNRIVAGSRPSALPPGLALHAELRHLAAAGLPGDQVLKAAGYNAARLLGLTGLLGEISPGARADLLLVSGDPLSNPDDLLNTVAVVRNGRFYSMIALLERATATVE